VTVTAFVIAVTTRFSVVEVLLYVLLSVFWLYEEYGRQWFMAHHRFAAQGLNDFVYLIIAVGMLAAWQILGRITLSSVLLSMATAAAVSTVAGQAAVPARSRVWRRPEPDRDLGAFSRYGKWRAAQAGVGALGAVATRSMIAGGLGIRTLGDLELGRTVAGPVTTVLGGLGNVLLPLMSAHSRANERSNYNRLSLLSTSFACLYGVGIVTFAPFLVDLFGGPGFRVSRTILAGWALVTVVIALTQSVSVRALVDLPSRLVFLLRLAGTVATLGLVGAASFFDSPASVPYATAVGTLLSGALLYVALKRVTASSADRT
jgi:O-antigen/teichoic acid export membrane protein